MKLFQNDKRSIISPWYQIIYFLLILLGYSGTVSLFLRKLLRILKLISNIKVLIFEVDMLTRNWFTKKFIEWVNFPGFNQGDLMKNRFSVFSIWIRIFSLNQENFSKYRYRKKIMNWCYRMAKESGHIWASSPTNTFIHLRPRYIRIRVNIV